MVSEAFARFSFILVRTLITMERGVKYLALNMTLRLIDHQSR
jgi:hypothetical protein